MWRGRRTWSLAAAGLLGLLAAVWWLGRWPGAGVAVSDPQPAGSSRFPPARPFGPVGAFRLEPPVAPPEHRDPLLGAIPADSRHVVVVEVNALLHAPLGRLWRGCLREYEQELLAALQKGGIDPLVDVDRVALAEGEDSYRRIAAASGFFGRADPAALVRTIASTKRDVDVRSYGGDATVFTFDMCIFECSPMALAARQDRTLLMGPPADVRGSLDLVQGRSEGEPFAFPGSLDAAEVFGVTDGRELARWLKLDDPVLKEWLSALRTRAELRVDAMWDVRASVRVTAEDPAAANDLAGLFGAAVAGSRSKALAAGDDKWAELLRYVTVSPGRGEFTVALDLPLEALERQFEGCRN